MIKSFDFVSQAWTDKTFCTHIQEYLYSNKSGRLCTDILVLSFDCLSRSVHISGVSDGGIFSSKIVPVRVTYEGMKKLIAKQFDNLAPDDVWYMPLD